MCEHETEKLDVRQSDCHCDKCVMSELKYVEEVKLESMCDESSMSPDSMISNPNGRETRLDLHSKISDLELENVTLQEEC